MDTNKKKAIISGVSVAALVVSFVLGFICGGKQKEEDLKEKFEQLTSSTNTSRSDTASTAATTDTTTATTEPGVESKTGDVVLVDDNVMKVTAKEIKKDSDFNETRVGLEIVNKTQQKITVQSRDCSIDGKMAEPIMSEDIMPGKYSDCEMNLGKLSGDFTSMAGKFHVYSPDGSLDDLDNPAFEIKTADFK